MNISVADHHLHISNAVNVQEELVELLELSWFNPVHREPAKLCPILNGDKEKKQDKNGGQKRMHYKQESEMLGGERVDVRSGRATQKIYRIGKFLSKDSNYLTLHK